MEGSTLSEHSLAGKVAVVTGGASGIGAATVSAFAKAGATVVVADLNEPTSGDGSTFRPCNVAEERAVVGLFSHCREQFGRVDVVFHAAGVGGGQAPLADYDLDSWDRVMAVNLRGSFMVLRSAIPLMLENGGGAIVLTSSIGGAIAAPHTGAYGVSKAGVWQLVRQAAADYAGRGIRVNGIAPGVIDTPMVGALTPEMRDLISGHVPQGRLGVPSEVAAAVAFLCSDDASYVNGTVLAIDGARLAV